jgi:hypothetical protein
VAAVRKSRTSGDAAIALLLPTVRRMLRSGVGVDALIRAAKQAYIRAAIAELLPPGSRVNVSRISVATGMSRREIAALVTGSNCLRRPLKHPKGQRAFRVLHGWNTDPSFHNRRGQPAELPLKGRGHTFGVLVRRYGGDVTPVAVLRELERLNTVTMSRGRLRLRPEGLRSLEHAHCRANTTQVEGASSSL